MNIEQVERTFKSSAYYASNNYVIFGDYGLSEKTSIPARTRFRLNNLNRHKHTILSSNSVSGSNHAPYSSNLDTTIILNPMIPIDNNNKDIQNLNLKYTRSNFNEEYKEKQSVYDINIKSNNIGTLFPSLGVIIMDVFDLYKANNPRSETLFLLIMYNYY